MKYICITLLVYCSVFISNLLFDCESSFSRLMKCEVQEEVHQISLSTFETIENGQYFLFEAPQWVNSFGKFTVDGWKFNLMVNSRAMLFTHHNFECSMTCLATKL